MSILEFRVATKREIVEILMTAIPKDVCEIIVSWLPDRYHDRYDLCQEECRRCMRRSFVRYPRCLETRVIR